ncbi:neuropeptide S receptor-like [Ostrea edulis]|uniref:neuropeptide S receptor-like n=1 Tax=Ostrea edulis TaxID=37623 RepID=UPI0020957C47|nr:neuropeptide S receptor-like [Ostrea edulis]XP_048752272.1 neuropeptide S receptor-like [Ostrea edulis]XP_048752273.1 neuropeptide S receptor-like [Ostrea edulis]XP_056016171.1 neuropeptide S receptor-like [Ostrea edulis]
MKEEYEIQVYIAIGYMSIFSVVGTIGNALVLYVFSRYKNKLTSTIFILTLAGVDFVTCCVTIPFTIATEAVKFHLKYDIICQIYLFLITTTVPFSAFVMVAIAVDRYLCIVYPFKHAMTIRRAEIIVGCLCGFAVLLGIICCSHYKIKPFPTEIVPTVYQNMTLLPNSSLSNSTPFDYVCLPQETDFFFIYQKIYSSFFGICALVVIILYGLIYRSVLARRRKKFEMFLSDNCCGIWSSQSFSEQTEITVLNNTEVTNAQDDNRVEETCDKAVQKNGNTQISDRDVILKPGGVSKAKLEKMRIANIKTAFMLSIVALVFIVAFLPSWLVALKILPLNIIVIYLYFIYNVANPVIYAFLNETFREQLSQRICCRRS